MPNRWLAILCVSLLSLQSIGQNPPPATQNNAAPGSSTVETAQEKPTVVPSMAGFGLEDGTPIKMRTARTVSSADAKVGDTLDFEVLEEVRVNGVVLIPKGGIAWATVTDAQSKRRMGRGGKLDVNVDSVRLVDGEKVPLRAVKEMKGGGHVGAMTGAMVATGIVFFPAAPLFLFMHGKDITIPKGTEITAYINGNTPLEIAKFQEKPAVAVPSQPAAQSASVDLSSNPSGADIEIDGKFMGNTPSSIPLSLGDHAVKISKSGFGTWERTISVSGGTIKISAELQSPAAN
jgi:hypothetical protein